MFTTPDSPTATPPNLAERQQALLNQLEAQRMAVQNGGMPFTFAPAVPAVMAADGVTVVTPAVPAIVGTIQTRVDPKFNDIQNINGEASEALILQGKGVTAAQMDFRDMQNVTHDMTPAQMIVMAQSVSTFINATYLAKWALQKQIVSLTADTIDSFDITQGWPAG